MARAKQDKLQFPDVLHALFSATQRYEASFASKLVATLDPSQPVIDSFVLENTGLRLPSFAAHNRSACICDVHAALLAQFSAYLAGEGGAYLTSEFRRIYPNAGITEIKMLDLVLWQTRS